MSQGGKQHKGQLQTVEGSPTGEYHVINRYDYNQLAAVELLGEARFGAHDNQFKWYIQKFEYNQLAGISAIKTASNRIQTLATTASVDTLSNPGFVKLTVDSGADFELVNVGDKVFLDTGTNEIGGQLIKQRLSPTSFLIEIFPGAVNESNTSISPDALQITLEADECKDYDKRRWDKRRLYIYQ